MNRRSNAVLKQIHTLFGGGSVVGLTDSELLERFVQVRDESAFAILVARHGPMVFAVCRRMLAELADAEDAFQATFLVLVRKAGTLSGREQVGNWLYGVAHRTALEARTRAARRRAREQGLTVKAWTIPPEVTDAPDLGQLLDEELRRLPDRYRAPLVLCALEGRTRADAARTLGLSEGTLSSRLSRARVLLRERLTRRGMKLPAGAVTAALARETSAAAVPQTLAQSTCDAAIRFAAGTTTAGAATAPAVNLAEGVLKMMMMTKLKLVAGALACSLVMTAGVVAQSQPNFGVGPVAPHQPAEATRLSAVERKLDRVLEVLGAQAAPPNAPPAPRFLEDSKVPAANPSMPPSVAPLPGMPAVGPNAVAKPEAQRLSDVEYRVTRIERELAKLIGRIDQIEAKGGTDNTKVTKIPVN